MKCARIRELISNSIDNELNEIERQTVDEHIKVCSACREFYQELKSLDSELDGIEPVFAAENFSRRVIKSLNQQHNELTVPSSVFENLRNWVAYGAVAGVVVLSLFIGNYIGKYLYKQMISGGIRSFHQKNLKMFGIAENRVNPDGISYIIYNQIEQEVHND